MTDADLLESAVSHRPWPLPDASWIICQSWRAMLFAHWPVSAAALRPLVPAPLIIDDYNGDAYVGLTPFHLTGLRVRPLPVLPIASDFPEMNLRTYVRFGDKPGIFFFSLDAASQLAVLGARFTFGLPYYHSEMRIEPVDDGFRCHSRRLDDPPATFEGRYRPNGDIFTPTHGSLEHFFTERYAFYTVEDGVVMRGDIHHLPWRIQRAAAELMQNTVAEAHGITLPHSRPLLHYAEKQDALIFAPRPAD